MLFQILRNNDFFKVEQTINDKDSHLDYDKGSIIDVNNDTVTQGNIITLIWQYNLCECALQFSIIKELWDSITKLMMAILAINI